MPSAAAADLGLNDPESWLDAGDLAHGVINSLKAGIQFADLVTTVSPTYAREIREGPLGMGMQAALHARADGVAGILNGVDYRDWDPRHDPHFTVHFGPQDLRGKRPTKELLMTAAGLDPAVSRPLIGMVTRLAEQKGIDLLFDALPAMLQQRDFGFLVLGSGDARYVSFFEDLAQRFPGRVAFRSGYDESWPIHRSRQRHFPDALALRALRFESNVACGTAPFDRAQHRRTCGSVQHFVDSGIGTGCVLTTTMRRGALGDRDGARLVPAASGADAETQWRRFFLGPADRQVRYAVPRTAAAIVVRLRVPWLGRQCVAPAVGQRITSDHAYWAACARAGRARVRCVIEPAPGLLHQYEALGRRRRPEPADGGCRSA